MSRETQVEQVDTDVDVLDDRAERVVDHSRELEEMRREKRDALEREQDARNETANSNGAVLTGWIRDATRDGGDYRIEVEVVDGGETRLETFCLDWPDDIDDANVENDVVALAHLVGDSDGLDDILEQEVPVVRRGEDEYRLGLPEKPSLPRRAGRWFLHRAINTGVVEADEDELRFNSTLFTAGIGLASLVPLAIGGTTVIEYASAFDTLVGSVVGVVGGLIASLFCMALFAALLAGSPESSAGYNDSDDDGGDAVLAVQLLAAAIITLVTAPDVAGATAGNLSAIFFTGANLVGGTTFAVAGLAGLAFAGIRFGATAITTVADKAVGARDWLRDRRGIDYRR